MSGKRGMVRSVAMRSLRQNMWRSMRIMRVFTIPALVCSVPGLKYENAQKFVRRLNKYGYINKAKGFTGGRAGEYQAYRLVNDIGPTMPVLSTGRFEKKEREKEKNTETEEILSEEIANDNDRPDATAA